MDLCGKSICGAIGLSLCPVFGSLFYLPENVGTPCPHWKIRLFISYVLEF